MFKKVGGVVEFDEIFRYVYGRKKLLLGREYFSVFNFNLVKFIYCFILIFLVF